MSWDVAPGDPVEMRAARQGLQDWLGEHQSHADDAVLVAAELMANAVVAARSTVILSAAMHGDRIVLEVSDDGSGDPDLDELGQRLPVVDSEKAAGSSSSARSARTSPW